MKKSYLGFALIVLITSVAGCQKLTQVEPEVIVCPIPDIVVRDSVETGSYLGINIGEAVEKVYPILQSFQTTKGVQYVQVVGPPYSDIIPMKDQLPLYQCVILNRKIGSITDQGIQIYNNGEQVESIYVSSKKVSQWPENGKSNAVVRVGDNVGTLYDKLIAIKNLGANNHRFESISVTTKLVNKDFDPAMKASPQWYFGYKTGEKTTDLVQVMFSEGKVSKFYINHHTTMY